MLRGRSCVRLCAAVLWVAAIGPPASAIVRRDDVDGNQYVAAAQQTQFDCVGSFSGVLFGSGTLVANNWVLTAGHVGTRGATMTFTLGSDVYDRAWYVAAPGYSLSDLENGNDYSLARLDELVLDVDPAPLYTASDELGQTFTTVGFGMSGTGATGATEASGTKRAGTNVWDVDGSYFGYASNIAVADFDSGLIADNWFGFGVAARTPTGLEFCAAAGDSGGGSFIQVGDQWYLAGITSFISYHDGAADSDYGDATFFMRVSSHLSWIQSVLSTSYTMQWAANGDAAYNSGPSWLTLDNSKPAVPGALDTARLDRAGTHVVTLPGAAISVSRLLVGVGDFTLDLAASSYAATSTAAPAFVVGDKAGTAGLELINGTFASPGGQIAPDANATATLAVRAGGAWDCSDAIYVGGSDTSAGGSGTLVIGAGGSLSCSAEVHVWSTGRLDYRGGGLSTTQVLLDGGALSGDGSLGADLASGGGSFDIEDGNSLTLSGGAAFQAAANMVKTGLGTLTISGAQSHAAGATLTAGAGWTVLASDAGPNLVVQADASVAFTADQGISALQVGSAGTAVLQGPSPVTVAVGGLSIATGGTVDIQAGRLEVQYASSPNEVLADVQAWVAAGAIMSSTGADPLKAVGYGDQVGYVLTVQTWKGDATLDGAVSGADLSALATHWNAASGATWADGDFNGDGAVNGADLAALATNWNKVLAPIGGSAVLVPEAAPLLLLAVGALAGVTRRHCRMVRPMPSRLRKSQPTDPPNRRPARRSLSKAGSPSLEGAPVGVWLRAQT